MAATHQHRWRFEAPPTIWTVRRSSPWNFSSPAGPLTAYLRWRNPLFELSFSSCQCEAPTRLSGECWPCLEVKNGETTLKLDPSTDPAAARAKFTEVYEEALVRRNENPLRATAYVPTLAPAFIQLAEAVRED